MNVEKFISMCKYDLMGLLHFRSSCCGWPGSQRRLIVLRGLSRFQWHSSGWWCCPRPAPGPCRVFVVRFSSPRRQMAAIVGEPALALDDYYGKQESFLMKWLAGPNRCALFAPKCRGKFDTAHHKYLKGKWRTWNLWPCFVHNITHLTLSLPPPHLHHIPTYNHSLRKHPVN